MAAVSPRRCPACGAELPKDTLEGLCPACLFARAIEEPTAVSATRSGEDPMMLSPIGTPESRDSREAPRLAPGLIFGSYRIGRLLGRGGMGEVYEAEQIEQHRRVALKVLRRRMRDPEDRARFLREGQLAASVNHPHAVYVFGSEEISGIPVIAMELLPGGTLKDLVERNGPLAPSAAVDAILQIVAGLDAAHAAGILHRDVKPGNCFIDHDGSVKIGDFGLSISTLARDAAQAGMPGLFQGTPSFAAPEQLRGEPLDVRADIYAVGATLYYLLTGRPPFEEPDLMALVARVTTEAVTSPADLRRHVPRALATVVLCCLAKRRADRPATYAVLDEALRPFSVDAPKPARLWVRSLACVIDYIALQLLSFPIAALLAGSRGFDAAIGFRLAYFACAEGWWGSSIGKGLCGIRVIGPSGRPPGVARALVRVGIFMGPIVVAAFLPTSGAMADSSGAVVAAVTAAFFLTARRTNGLAGLHEVLSGTRVVARRRRGARPRVTTIPDVATIAARGHHGAFDVTGSLGSTGEGQLLAAFDPVLRRPVWIHVRPLHTPAVSPLLRDLGRPGRLRWLAGQRTPVEAWDAYEGLTGGPLVRQGAASWSWPLVRSWLLDLGKELDAGLKDGSLPILQPDRVWLTGDGRAVLLDFRAPRSSVPPTIGAPAEIGTSQEFLSAVASHALTTRPGAGSQQALGHPPLPLSASIFLSSIAQGRVTESRDLLMNLTTIARGPDRISRATRALHLGLCSLLPIIVALSFLTIGLADPRVVDPEIQILTDSLAELRTVIAEPGAEVETKRAALEVFIAGRFRPMLMDIAARHASYNVDVRRLAASAAPVLALYPVVSEEELLAAIARLQPFLDEEERRISRLQVPDTGVVAARVSIVLLYEFMLISLPAVAFAFFFRGGLLLRGFGIAVVDARGHEVSRWRGGLRAFIAWLPMTSLVAMVTALVSFPFAVGSITTLMLTLVAAMGSPTIRLALTHGPVAIAFVVMAVTTFLVGAILTTFHPERGLQDRLAGTWLVPR